MSTSKSNKLGHIELSFIKQPAESLYSFFLTTDNDQSEPLSLFVDLKEYAIKLTEKANIIYALKSGKIVGICAFYYNPSPSDSFLTLLLISKSCRGNHLGKRLMEEMIQYCHSSQGIRLEVSETNLVALSLYKDLGFVIVDTQWNSKSNSLHLTMHLTTNG